MPIAIAAHNLGKSFRAQDANRPWTLKEAILRGRLMSGPQRRFWALQHVTFTAAAGEMVGVIGRNGSGKSTLLRLVGGVYRPSEGTVQVTGRLGALLELGAGFHPDLTGRENLIINGVVAGLTRREVAERFEQIVEFAGLEEFIDMPMRTFSTGMQMRLGFAVAVHTDPTILLVDEVMSVGDLSFQRKCLERIEQLRADGCAVLLVTHDVSAVRRLCDQAIWLDAGQLVAYGPPDLVVDKYESAVAEETRRRTPALTAARRTADGLELHASRNRFGSLELEITSVRLLDRHGAAVTTIDTGGQLHIELEYQAHRRVESPIFGVTISRDELGVCFESSTEAAGVQLPNLAGGTGGRVYLHVDRLDLAGGQYTIDVGAYDRSWSHAFDYHWHAYRLRVEQTALGKGILAPPQRWSIDVDAPPGVHDRNAPLRDAVSVG